MKEMVKSKFMIGFVVFVVGFSYMNSMQMRGMQVEDTTTEIVMAETK